MSKFQPAYNQAKRKESIEKVPEIQDQIKSEEEKKRNATTSLERKASDARIKSLKIKLQSYKHGDPVREDAQGVITTTSVGSPNTVDGTPAKGENSALYYPKVGPMVSRRGDIKSKKKKKVREFIEYYFEDK